MNEKTPMNMLNALIDCYQNIRYQIDFNGVKNDIIDLLKDGGQGFTKNMHGWLIITDELLKRLDASVSNAMVHIRIDDDLYMSALYL